MSTRALDYRPSQRNLLASELEHALGMDLGNSYGCVTIYRNFCDLDEDLVGLQAFTKDKSKLPSELLSVYEERLQSKAHLPKGKLELSDQKSDI